MALSPIAFIAPNFRDFKNDYLKAYEPGTTTPKVMALDADNDVQVAKLQLNADGFIVSASNALVIPYISGPYDLWLFPTEAEADANDTSNAERLADNITPPPASGVIKPFDTLALAVADVGLIDGDSINLEDYTLNNDGGAFWDVVLLSTVVPDNISIWASTGVITLALVLRKKHQVIADEYGAIGDSVVDDTNNISSAINTRKQTLFDLSKTYKVTDINLNNSVHLENANLVFNGFGAGFDVDTAITGLSMKNCKLTGDSNLANAQKGITSNQPITKGFFSGVQLFGFQQGFDLNSAVQTIFTGNWVENSVGVGSGEGYGVIAGSSQRGTFTASIFEKCARHGLYLNNALYSTVGNNVFFKHRDGLGAGGTLGALQFNGQAKSIASVGNSFSLNEGPECVMSPNDENTSPQEAMLIAANTFYQGQSLSVRVGNQNPGLNKKVMGCFITANMFYPLSTTSNGIVRVLAGDNINVSNNSWHLDNGTGASPIAIAIGETTPDDAHFDNIAICNNSGIFTGDSGQAKFIRIAEELCLGTTRVDIFNNNVETDLLIDYETNPTNPNIRTDHQRLKSITLSSGSQDLNVAGFNNFLLTGDVAGSTIANITNGYKDKIILIRISDVNVVTMTSTGNKSLAGTFTSTNKDVIVLKFDGATWIEHTRSLNT